MELLQTFAEQAVIAITAPRRIARCRRTSDLQSCWNPRARRAESHQRAQVLRGRFPLMSVRRVRICSADQRSRSPENGIIQTVATESPANMLALLREASSSRCRDRRCSHELSHARPDSHSRRHRRSSRFRCSYHCAALITSLCRRSAAACSHSRDRYFSTRSPNSPRADRARAAPRRPAYRISAATYRALQTRTSDLQESLEYQTATSDVLKVISGSGFALEPVFQAVVGAAVQLCSADQALLVRHENGIIQSVAKCRSPEYLALLKSWGLIDLLPKRRWSHTEQLSNAA